MTSEIRGIGERNDNEAAFGHECQYGDPTVVMAFSGGL